MVRKTVLGLNLPHAKGLFGVDVCMFPPVFCKKHYKFSVDEYPQL